MNNLYKQQLPKFDHHDIGRTTAHAHNTGFASGGGTCKLGALCFY